MTAPSTPRYIAKPYTEGKTTRWGVYDTRLGSWPVQRRGYVVQGEKGFRTEAEAQTVADDMTEKGI